MGLSPEKIYVVCLRRNPRKAVNQTPVNNYFLVTIEQLFSRKVLTFVLALLALLTMREREQFNFTLGTNEARAINTEAMRRGMTDNAGEANRAMIARALVLERLEQLRSRRTNKRRAMA